MRKTSIDAYVAVNSTGYIAKTNKEIYNILYSFGPMTAGEAFIKFQELNDQKLDGRNEVAKRVYDLCKLGVVEDIGEQRKCAYSGSVCEVWDVTAKVITSKPKITTEDRIRMVDKRISKFQEKREKLVEKLIAEQNKANGFTITEDEDEIL